MPIRDDLILRTIDQVAALVARLLGGAAGGATLDEAERTLADAYQTLTGSRRELVARLSSEQLLAILGAPTAFNRERGYALARLCEADAVLLRASGQAERADVARLQALDLYLAGVLAGLDEPDLGTRIDDAVAALDGVVLPPTSLWRLFDVRVEQGAYAAAEDLLFEALERSGPRREVIERGRAFYRALEGSDDDALERGGLPRPEVAEGRAAFERAAAQAAPDPARGGSGA